MKAATVNALGLAVLLGGCVLAPPVDESSQPHPGQPGKDVVWFPTPAALVEKMLDMARVTPQDYVVDLGSGDGRNIIAAAKRGAHALGVEYDPQLVVLSQRAASAAGVSDKAKFIRGDMFEADISQATVLALFLLPDNLRRLSPKFLAQLRPGTRIVSNAFLIPGWDMEEEGRSDGDCAPWCTAYLYLVPAQAAGTWRLGQGELVIDQQVQAVSGQLTAEGAVTPVRNGRMKGDEIRFALGMAQYLGRVKGDTMSGTVEGSVHGYWRATRVSR
jgi:SAM-dependent methyltransferase